MTDPIVGFGSTGLPITQSQAQALAAMGKTVANPIGSDKASSIISSYTSPNPLTKGTTFQTQQGATYAATGSGLNVVQISTGTSADIGSGLAPYSLNTKAPPVVVDIKNSPAQVGYMDFLIHNQKQKAAFGTPSSSGFMTDLISKQTSGKVSTYRSLTEKNGGYVDNLLNVISGGAITGFDSTKPITYNDGNGNVTYSPPDLNIVPETNTIIKEVTTNVFESVSNSIETIKDALSGEEKEKSLMEKYGALIIVGLGAYALAKRR